MDLSFETLGPRVVGFLIVGFLVGKDFEISLEFNFRFSLYRI